MTTARLNQSLQLLLLLIREKRAAVFKRFDTEIAELGSILFGVLKLALDLDQIGRRLLHETCDFFFDARQLLLNRGQLALIMSTNVFQFGDLIRSQIQFAFVI